VGDMTELNAADGALESRDYLDPLKSRVITHYTTNNLCNKHETLV